MSRTVKRLTQIALPLDWSAEGHNDPPLVVGACNSDALRFLARPGDWPVRSAVLIGPPQSGRSLMGRVFARSSGGRVIDGPAGHSEEAIFHAWNSAQASGEPLLLIADAPPAAWGVKLPDLASRLAAVPVVRIGDPDDGYARDYIEVHFAQRGMVVGADVAEFIVRRMHRSHAVLARIVEALDLAALSERRRIGKRLAGEVLREAGLIAEDLIDQVEGSR